MSTAVVLMCDTNFLAPTIGTALQARAHITDPRVDIRIVVTDSDALHLSAPAAKLEDSGIRLESFPISALTAIRSEDFNKTHVPVSTMARLWIDEVLPPVFDRFLYLDGDLEITGSLDPLLAEVVPHRGFLAAPDLPYLIAGDSGATARQTGQYLKGLGLTAPEQYFNAGVLLADRRGWREIAGVAWDYFKAHPQRCRYHDQSALNATAQARRGTLSLRWNYQTDFLAAADPRRWGYPPAIWHFTGFPKPWHAATFPWGPDHDQTYWLGSRLLDDCGFPPPPPADPEQIRAGVHGREKLRHRLTWVYPWRRIARARRIKEHLIETWGGIGARPSPACSPYPPTAIEQAAS